MTLSRIATKRFSLSGLVSRFLRGLGQARAQNQDEPAVTNSRERHARVRRA